ncbi:MAG: right-handed parallel beta-helix repeat-containing protein [Planctomycetota bacterium]
MIASLVVLLATPSPTIGQAGEPIRVRSTDGLVAAVENAGAGDRIELAAGVYLLKGSLTLGSDVTLVGAGPGETILQNDPGWSPDTTDRPDNETRYDSADRTAYLFDIPWKTKNVTLEGMTLKSGTARGSLHGAVLAGRTENLVLKNLAIGPFRWSGVRTFVCRGGSITRCTFTDAGGKMRVTKGSTGAAIFLTYAQDLEIAHNRFVTTDEHPANVFGIKGRGVKSSTVHHNTIRSNFAIEMPFENDQNVEIHHNYLGGVVSIPKHAGGMKMEESDLAFHIHHNYFTTSYSIEGPRNGVLIESNVFDFDAQSDGGNLISCFGRVAAPGPLIFQDNLVRNPGRGVLWSGPNYGRVTVRNNKIVGRKTATPRTEGLFGLGRGTDFSTVQFLNNEVELTGLDRPLVRGEEMFAAEFENNRLTGVSDAARTAGPQTDAPVGPRTPLTFRLGAEEEFALDGFELSDVD